MDFRGPDLGRRKGKRRLDFHRLAETLGSVGEDIVFAVVLGSCRAGILQPEADLDIALRMSDGHRSAKVCLDAPRALARDLPDVMAHVGVLNRAEPIYRFEAASGRLLFTGDIEVGPEFFSRAAREDEYQMADYERQWRYRREAALCCSAAQANASWPSWMSRCRAFRSACGTCRAESS